MSNSLYQRSNLARVPELQKLVPEGATAFFQFMHQAFAPRLLSARTKELIAVAVTHVTGCPYCIDVHTGKFKGYQGTPQEAVEAVLVAGAVNAETVLFHSANALNTFGGKGGPEDPLYETSNMDVYNSEAKLMSPVAFEAFDRFAEEAFREGAVDAKTKQLIAFVIAHVNGCAYSIDRHSRRLADVGATREEALEALMIGGVANAGYVLTHGINALNAFDQAGVAANG